MKKNILFVLLLLIIQIKMDAQNKSFTIESRIPGMKDGIVVCLSNSESGESEILAQDTVKNGSFRLVGSVEHPIKCCLTTNNLAILSPQEQENAQNIRWTYTDLLVDNVPMIFKAENYDSISVDEPIGKSFEITGGKVQADFNEYNRLLLAQKQLSEEEERKFQLDFIHSHPHSVISLMLANNLIQDGFHLQKADIVNLEKTIVSVPAAPKRLAEFRKNCQLAKRSTINSDIVDLPLTDINGKPCRLTEVVPKGKYVLVDFWASWCGICLEGIPEIKEIAKKHTKDFVVIGVSADTKIQAWKNAIIRKQLPWKQYRLTSQGIKDLMSKYLIKGVPYYIIVNPQGKVISSPEYPKEIGEQIDKLCE